jgi:DNA polymerase I-like protein with 3'-5' exonuclease and polymerase domains
MSNKKHEVEITTFRLQSGTFKEFIKANMADIDGWLKAQKGFQSRTIAQQKDGTIVDMVWWDTAADGTDAMQRIISETATSKVHDMIDHGTVSWTIAETGHVVNL